MALMMFISLTACGSKNEEPVVTEPEPRVQMVVEKVVCTAEYMGQVLDFFETEYTYNTDDHSIVIEKQYFNDSTKTKEVIVRDENDEMVSYTFSSDNLPLGNGGKAIGAKVVTTFENVSENEAKAVTEMNINGGTGTIEYNLISSVLANGNTERRDMVDEIDFCAESRETDPEGRLVDRKGYSSLESDDLAYYGRALTYEGNVLKFWDYYTEFKTGGDPFSLITMKFENIKDDEGNVVERNVVYSVNEGISLDIKAIITYTTVEAVESYELPDMLAEDIFFGFNKENFMALPLYH